MSNEDDGGIGLFGKLQDGGGALADLCHTAGRRLDQFGGDGLDGVDNHQLGLYVLDVGKDVFQRCLADDETVGRIMTDAVGTQLQLSGTLLTRHIEDAPFGHAQDGLQHQRRLSDAGLTTQQHQGAGHQSAAQHPVELIVVHVDARLFTADDVRQDHRLVALSFRRCREGCAV